MHIVTYIPRRVFAANEASAYTQCSQPHRNFILTAIQLKFSQINLKMMAIQKIGKYTFCSNYPKGPFLRGVAHLISLTIKYTTQTYEMAMKMK